MKSKILLIFLLSCTFSYLALAQDQGKSALVFQTITYDFGDILLSDGKKDYSFVCNNTGDKPIVIQTVIASCGCTAPDWPKEPIMPGASAKIKVTFLNNQGPYPFDKTLAVYSTATEKPITLRVRGSVHERAKSLSELFPIAFGSLRLRTSQYSLGVLYPNRIKSDSAQVVNNGKKPITVTFKEVSKGLSMHILPLILEAGAKGYLHYTIDTRIYQDWGAVSLTARPLINGTTAGNGVLEITGDLRADFSQYTKEQLRSAPVPSLDSDSYRFDNIKQGQTISTSFTLSNKGNTKLLIYDAQSSDAFLTVTAPKEVEAGKSAVIKVWVNTKDKKGELIGGITLITNAPVRPTIHLLVSGTVIP